MYRVVICNKCNKSNAEVRAGCICLVSLRRWDAYDTCVCGKPFCVVFAEGAVPSWTSEGESGESGALVSSSSSSMISAEMESAGCHIVLDYNTTAHLLHRHQDVL
jgi:hypothetical protein